MRRICVLALVFLARAYASAEMPRLNPPDLQLGKKVTLEVDHAKLEDVAKLLSEQSGVSIKAGSGQRDWKVRERTVTIRAKDVMLGDLLDHVSRALSFYISREGKEGEWTYIIWQDKKSRDLESEMVTAQKEAEAQRVKDSRQAAVDQAGKALKMKPEDALKLKDKDPWTAYLGGTKSGRGFAGLLSSLQSQFPSEYDLMMRGKRAFFSVSPGMQQYANDAASGGMAAQFKKMTGDAAKNMVPSVLAMMPVDGFSNGNDNAGLLGLSGMMFIGGLMPGQQPDPNNPFGGMPMGFFSLMSPSSVGAKVFGELLFDVEAGASMEDASSKLQSKYGSEAMMLQMLARESPTEKDPPTDPELTREVEIKADALPDTKTLRLESKAAYEAQGKAIAEISRVLGEPVVLESFTNLMPVSVHLKSGKQPVYKIMIALEKADYSWEHQDGVLRIRPNDWALRRSYLIPESYMAYYKDIWKNKGELSFDDVTSIVCSLTDDQLNHTFLADADFRFLAGTLSSSFGGSRDILRFYGALSEVQRQSLESEAGLAFRDLSDAQWDQMNKIITDRFGGIYVTDGSVHMTAVGKDRKSLSSRTFEITVYVTEEKDPRKMNQPVYIPTRESIAETQKAIKDTQDKAKSGQNAPPSDPDAPK